MSAPDHELRVNLKQADEISRRKVLRSVQYAGGKVLNDDVVAFLASAPPAPGQALRIALENEMKTRPPFSVTLKLNDNYGQLSNDPEFRAEVAKRLKPRGIKDRSVAHGILALGYGFRHAQHHNSDGRWSYDDGRLSELDADYRSSGDSRIDLTIYDPSLITVDVIRSLYRGNHLGEQAATTALAVLVELSRGFQDTTNGPQLPADSLLNLHQH